MTTPLTDEQQLSARTRTELVALCAAGFAYKHNLGHMVDDLTSVAYLALCEAVQSYDASKGASLNTYITLRVNGAMKDYIQREVYLTRCAQAGAKPLCLDDSTAQVDDMDELDHLLASLDPLEATALRLRYIDGRTQLQVSQAMQMRLQTCIDLIETGLTNAAKLAAETH